ncbi:MAG: LysR family transcriptional regulator [Butyrivibrio sp.]
MTLFSYKVFITTVEQMNFRKAAELLNLTPSAVSHCISNMEDELGFPLFIRNKNRISLTSNAELLLPYIRHLLAGEDSLNQAIGELKGFQRGLVRLGCFNSVCTSWIPQLVRDFHEQYPGIDIELFQGTYDDITGWLEKGDIDIGFLSVSSAGKIPIEPLYNDRLMVVVPKGFVTSNPDYITIQELADCNFVQPMENCDADSQKLFDEYGLSAKSQCHVVDDLSILTMVSAGFGVCILPKMLIDSFDVDVDVYPVEPEYYRVIGIACSDPSRSVPAVQKLYNVIIDKFKQI